MIDITPLDVRKKRGDFGKRLRGYDPEEVDTFLELVADRLEEAVKEVVSLREKVTELQKRVERSEGREQAVQEALVMAQELREEIRSHARREADLIKREAEEEVERVRSRLHELVEERGAALEEVERWRSRILRSLRGFLEGELESVRGEEEKGFDVDRVVRERAAEAAAEAPSGESAHDEEPPPADEGPQWAWGGPQSGEAEEGMLPLGPEAAPRSDGSQEDSSAVEHGAGPEEGHERD